MINPKRTIEEKLSRARVQLLLDQPFFGTLCLRLRFVPLPSVPTMATDGRRIVCNPAFVEKLSPAELEGVLAHEVMHLALAHHCRRDERDAQLWNQATDYAVNPILINNGRTLPKDALIDPAFADLGAEEIYARLLRQRQDSGKTESPPQPRVQPANGGGGGRGPEQAPQTKVQGAESSQEQTQKQPELPGLSDQLAPGRPGGFGEVLDAVGEDGQPASQAELTHQPHEWAINAEQAICSAKACGREPGGSARLLERVRQSERDWRQSFATSLRPQVHRIIDGHRQTVASCLRGLYLPSVQRSGVGEVVIVVDTSGSVGTRELEQFAGEINAIASDAQPEWIRVIYCDAAVQAVDEFGPSERIKLSPKGGGGTDFVPAFRWVEENDIEPKCLIYLTDLCCNSFPPAPDYPVLWVTDSRKRAPFGETVRLTFTSP